MPRDQSGDYVRTDGVREGPNIFEEQRAADLDIASNLLDVHENDIGEAITGSLPRDGRAGMTGPLSMGTNQIKQMAEATEETDATTYAQLLGHTTPFVNPTEVGGTANAISLTPQIAVTAYETGRGWRFFAEADNTGRVTLSVSGLAPVPLQRLDGAELEAGDIVTGRHIYVVYSGSAFLSDIAAAVEASDPTSTLPWGSVTGKPGTFPPSSHTHNAGDINAGQLGVARGGTGSGTAAGARTNFGLGTLATLNSVGNAQISDVAASKITGVVPPDHVGTGGSSSGQAKFLREDGTFADPFPSGVQSVSPTNLDVSRASMRAAVLVTSSKPKVKLTAPSSNGITYHIWGPNDFSGAAVASGSISSASGTVTTGSLTPGIYGVDSVHIAGTPGLPGSPSRIEAVA